MRKQWLGICIAASLLAACTSDDGQQQATVAPPQPAVCNGPIVEISGADPVYEPLNASANQDYERDGKSYKIVQDPSRFSQAGFAAIYDAEPGSNLTATGEAFDPMQLTAAHPTLPVPSYARITNLANGRMIVVRINDRGPYGNDRVISLSRAAADRLNTSNNTKVRIDRLSWRRMAPSPGQVPRVRRWRNRLTPFPTARTWTAAWEASLLRQSLLSQQEKCAQSAMIRCRAKTRRVRR